MYVHTYKPFTKTVVLDIFFQNTNGCKAAVVTSKQCAPLGLLPLTSFEVWTELRRLEEGSMVK
jgi:hypothetical protein